MPVSEIFCGGCTTASGGTGPDNAGRLCNVGPCNIGPVIVPGNIGAAIVPGSGELLRCTIIRSTGPALTLAPADDDDDDGVRIRGRPAAAAVLGSIGGLDITERLIISVRTRS